MTRTSCPKCGECPFIDGVCEQKIARGRRFFLLGALALPVAAKIERVAKIIAPPVPASTIEYDGNIWVWAGDVRVGSLVDISGSMANNGLHYVIKAEPFRYALKKR